MSDLKELRERGERRCYYCKNVFPATPEYFAKKRGARLGIGYICRTCNREYARKYYKPRYDEDRFHYTEPRTSESGILILICPVCQKQFRTNNPRTIYDTPECQKSVQNKRRYERRKRG